MLVGLSGCSAFSSITRTDCDGGSCDMAVEMDMAVALDLSPPPDLVTPPDYAGMKRFQFVMSEVVLPDARYAARKFMFDVDGNGTVENRFAAVVDAIRIAGGVPLQDVVQENIGLGKVLMLLDVATWDPAFMNDRAAFISSYVGTLPMGADPLTLFTGDAKVGVDPTPPPFNNRMELIVDNGRAQTRRSPAGVVVIRFPLLDVDPVPLPLWSAHLEFQVTPTVMKPGNGFTIGNHPPDGYWATVNGAVRTSDIENKLAPAVAQMIQKLIEKKRDIGDMGVDTVRQQLLAQFDKDNNLMVTKEEVLAHPLVSLILNPDLDLFDANGKYNPGQDKVPDCVSFGANFQAVSVEFTPPSP